MQQNYHICNEQMQNCPGNYQVGFIRWSFLRFHPGTPILQQSGR